MRLRNDSPVVSRLRQRLSGFIELLFKNLPSGHGELFSGLRCAGRVVTSSPVRSLEFFCTALCYGTARTKTERSGGVRESCYPHKRSKRSHSSTNGASQSTVMLVLVVVPYTTVVRVTISTKGHDTVVSHEFS